MRALPLALFLALTPAIALAGADEQAVSLGIVGGRVDPGPAPGMDESRAGFVAALSFDYDYGLNDTFNLRASLNGGTWFAPDGRAWSGSATAGLVYVFDLFRYIPRLTVGGGVLFLQGGGLEKTFIPIAEVGGGVDILESRSLSWGAFLRVHIAAQSQNAFFVGVRGSYRWGYF